MMKKLTDRTVTWLCYIAGLAVWQGLKVWWTGPGSNLYSWLMAKSLDHDDEGWLWKYADGYVEMNVDELDTNDYTATGTDGVYNVSLDKCTDYQVPEVEK